MHHSLTLGLSSCLSRTMIHKSCSLLCFATSAFVYGPATCGTIAGHIRCDGDRAAACDQFDGDRAAA
jgi:hypothetical protein